MKIMVTGAKGFIGRNLVENLCNIKDGKNTTRPFSVKKVISIDRESSEAELIEGCREADFVFHLAGVNRPGDPSEFMEGNRNAAGNLLAHLRECGNCCPVMLSSSVQAGLEGRFADSEYGKSKLEGEELFFRHAKETGAKVLVYRFPNVYGKWCRPNYNSAVATFCYNTANDIPLTIHDPSTELTLLYIDDLIEELFDAIEGKEHHSGKYCYVPLTHKKTLGEIAELLQSFHEFPCSRMIPDLPEQIGRAHV